MAGTDDSAAFTLVEIMIVVVIIGLLAALAIPAFQKVQIQSRASRFANDFRQYEAAYERFFIEGNAKPGVTGGGIIPIGMSGYLPASYAESSVMGGYYWWSGPSSHIVLVGSTADDVVMQKVDAILDDGDLTTGEFTKTGAGFALHVR
ncbi:MAG: prepilin-type N-terminal cleavage/methylation domain-containing protein [Opitutae bacterium]